MRHTDEIQIDRSYNKAAKIIERLINENSILKNENIALKNKPDNVYNMPPKKNFKYIVGKDRIDLSCAVNKWNTNHFLRYFQKKFKEKYNTDYKISGGAWKACAFRIKQFQDTHEELTNNEDYKNMVDWLFAEKFNSKFIASIPLISTDSMLIQWKVSVNGKPSQNFDDLIANVPKSKKSTAELLKDAF